jgi:5-methylcytosine-specific restriction endonuclease McrA
MTNHRRPRYSVELLAEAAAASSSVAGVLRFLGIRPTGGSHSHISRRLKAAGIDTRHFTGSGHNRGQRQPRKPWEEILLLRPEEAGRVKPVMLRRALVEYGVPYVCVGCGNPGEWRGRRLTLHVDHINGKHWDCRPENLRFLCPNCHCQTPTWAGANRIGARPRSHEARPPESRVQSGIAAQLLLDLWKVAS